jgi:LAO/AO transport system kinase
MREVARLVTLVERDDPAAVAERAAPLAAIESNPLAPVVGFTGAPGVGKSTLLGALASALAAGSDRRIAIVAVDPSSAVTGGALLGDRTRIRVPEGRVFIRSQASQAESGGLAPTTYPVVRALRRLFDLVLVETLGVGQSEDDIRHVADATYLLLQPLAGDSVQHLKAGLMEAPDVIVVTKCDVADLAHRALADLRGAIGLARPGETIPLHAVSARTGAGIDDLAAAVAATKAGPEQPSDDWFVARAVRTAHGRVGAARLAEHGPVSGRSLDERLAEALARSSASSA